MFAQQAPDAKQPKKSPLSGTKVRLSPHSPSKHRNLQEALKSPSSGTKVDAPGTNLEVDLASGNAVAVKTEGVLSMKTGSSARGENVRDTEDVEVNKRHGVKTSKKRQPPLLPETKPNRQLAFLPKTPSQQLAFQPKRGLKRLVTKLQRYRKPSPPKPL